MHLTALRQARRCCAMVRGKTICTMRIILLLCTALGLQSIDQVAAQNIHLNLRNVPPETVLSEIKKQTDYRFVYTREQLEGLPMVTVQLRRADIERALRACFPGGEMDWTIAKKLVVLKRKTAAVAGSQQPTERIVKGRVITTADEPMEGVTIRHVESGRQSLTNELGVFEMSIPGWGTLVFSYAGFENVELTADEEMLVQMRAGSSLLDEAVVIAYGSTTRRLNTGSVGSVRAAELRNQPVTNPLAALQGRVAGLQITQQGGLPGAGFSVLIRGRNSIQNGVSPLVIIDGVPFMGPDEQLMQRGSFSANSPFATINPKDIESIEVLKDADATSIYGSRGANGVILITTKRASKTGSQVSMSLYYGAGKQARVLPYMGLKDYLAMRREAFANDSVVMTNANAPDLLLWDTTKSLDWRKTIMDEGATSFNASVGYEAGSDVVQFALRSNYNAETTVMPGDFASKGAHVSLSASYRPKHGKLTAEFGSGYAYQNSLLPLKNMGEYLNLPPHAMQIYDSTGGYNWGGGGASFMNPMAVLEQTHRGITQRISLNQRLQWKLLPRLTFGLSAGMNNVWFDETTLTPILSQRPSPTTAGSANYGTNQIENWSIEPQIEFHTSVLPKLKLHVLGGGSLQATNSKSSTVTGNGYNNDVLLQSISGATSLTAVDDKSEYRYQALFFRLNLQWKEQYLLNVTGRRDGSSRFGPNKRYANFGAVGAGWIFSKEKWLAKSTVLSFGKLRGSYGVTGNDQIRNYQYLDSWISGIYAYQGVPMIKPNKLFNPDYSWEQIRKAEVGIELGLFEDRLFTTLNYFRSRSDNQIVNYPLPLQTGFGTILKNFPGVVENRGWELQVETVNIERKSFQWKSSFNISFPKNSLRQFPLLEQSSYANSLRIGKPLNNLIGYVYNGIDVASGMYTFDDINKDGIIDTKDKVFAGSTDPKYYGGFLNSIHWKRFELDVFFEFRKQQGIHPFLTGAGAAGRMLNMPEAMKDRWQRGVEGGFYQLYSQRTSGPISRALSLMGESDARLTDASYVRLKNVHLGYKLPSAKPGRTGISSAQLYLQAQNLLTFTDYIGADPENQGLTGLSPLRRIALGIHLQF